MYRGGGIPPGSSSLFFSSLTGGDGGCHMVRRDCLLWVKGPADKVLKYDKGTLSRILWTSCKKSNVCDDVMDRSHYDEYPSIPLIDPPGGL